MSLVAYLTIVTTLQVYSVWIWSVGWGSGEGMTLYSVQYSTHISVVTGAQQRLETVRQSQSPDRCVQVQGGYTSRYSGYCHRDIMVTSCDSWWCW